MSNVLIGIIGVILFIGLALAGALILGDDFTSSSATSKAAAITSIMQQTANAANMYELKTGNRIMAVNANTNGSFLVPRFLKLVPTNPHSQIQLGFVDSGGGGNTGLKAEYVYSNIGSDDVAKRICRAIEEGAGAANSDEALNPANITSWANWVAAHKRVGCILNVAWTPAVYQTYIPV